MKKIFDLYGSDIADPRILLDILQTALDLQFESHESSYLGEYFRWGQQYGEEMLVQRNFDESEKEFRENGFKRFPTLLYVNLSKDPDEVRRKLSLNGGKVAFLERREVP